MVESTKYFPESNIENYVFVSIKYFDFLIMNEITISSTEAARVIAFQKINEDKSIEESYKLSQLGNLMSKSHASLRSLYECSHPQVDALVKATLECGALGARLTGAG